MRFELELPRDLDSAAVARHTLGGLDGRLPADQLGDVRLLVSELVTNAIAHAEFEAPDGIALLVDVTDARVRVDVCDPGRGFEPASVPADPAPGEAGIGLLLVETLSDRWGVDRRAGATCVWFELDRDEAAAA